MSNLRLLIVDDEPVIRLGIRSGIAKIGGIEIVGECETGAQAIESILSGRPDVVFLDMRLPDSTGLDVVEHVGPQHMPLVVFVTAYDAYAVQAFELNAVDYLLKPFDQKRLQKTVERVRERWAARGHAKIAGQVRALLEQRPSTRSRRIVVRNGGRYEFVPVETIDWIESANNYVQLHCGGKTHLLSETLGGLEQKLAPETFLRIHRCRIVNISRITAIQPAFDETYEVELRGGVRLTSGRQFKKAVQELIRR